ncbi:MAG: trehalase family glycosidase [Chloroflexota bacterium]
MTNSGQRWSVLAAIGLATLAYLLWQLGQYARQLWRQPRLISRQVQIERLPDAVVEAEATAVAEANVRSGLEQRVLLNGEKKLVLCAGARNFREPWARDFGFASFGLLAMGEVEATKECLDVFLLYQRPSGQFPVKVHSTNILNRVLHAVFQREQPITAPLRPKYKTAHHTISLDGNALLVTAVLHYATEQDDLEFLAEWWPRLEQAMTWLAEHEQGDQHLLHQRPFADWADSIARSGFILYTNVLYWKATSEMAQAASRLNRRETAEFYAHKAHQLQANIQAHFWDETLGYFITSQQFHNLSSAGNLLAIAWGLATPTQGNLILDKMAHFQMADPVPTQVVNFPYPKRYIGIENRLAGIPHYHTSAAWLWLGSWHVVALARLGRHEEANQLFRRLSELIVRDGVVHEAYGKDGRFLSTRWYTSEAPLTWNAGMIVYANHVLQQTKAALA